MAILIQSTNGSKLKNIKSYTYESKDFTELDKLYYLAKIKMMK